MADFDNDDQEINENKENTKKQFNYTLIIVALIIAFAYIFIELKKISYQEKIRQENITKQENQKILLDNCMKEAEENYNYNWDRSCKTINKKPDCLLPNSRVNSLNKYYSDARQECLNKYKNEAFPLDNSNNHSSNPEHIF